MPRPARPVRDRLLELLPGLADPGDDCILWPRKPAATGYGIIYDGERQRGAHVVVCELFVGPVPPGEEVRHSCDVRPCVNPRHLAPGTRQQNVDDMRARGRERKAQGPAASSAKLTEMQVREIRSRHAAGENYRQLARAFGLAHPNIRAVVLRLSYKEVA